MRSVWTLALAAAALAVFFVAPRAGAEPASGARDAAPKPSVSPKPDPPARTQWGYALADVRTGKILAENGGRRFLIPASVVKSISTALAVEKLGADHRFSTVLYHTGKVESGILQGDLWIRGGGSPALGSRRADTSQSAEVVFARFAEALQAKGIREVRGHIRVDASLLEPEPPARGALWEDVGNYYAAPPAGLCYRDNSYSLLLDGSPKAGQALSALGTNPRHTGVAAFQVFAHTSSPRSGDSCYILGAYWNTPRVVVGTCPAGKQPLEIRGSLPDPAWTLAREFEDYLQARSLALNPTAPIRRASLPLPAAETLPGDTVRLAEHLSPDVLALSAVVNGYSDNLWAEQLLALAAAAGGSRDAEGRMRLMQSWLEKAAPGLGKDFQLVDGNGLSRRNRLTPAGLARLHCAWSKRPWFSGWRETLLGGKLCPLKPAAYAEGLPGKVWVKTGSMEGVASLAGYIQAASGRLLAFAIVANHFEESPHSLRNRWRPLLASWAEKY